MGSGGAKPPGNRGQTQVCPRRSGAGRRGPRERRRWGVRRGEAPRLITEHFMNNVIDFINTHRDRYVEELKAYLAIPSISALPQHAADVRKCAEWTQAEMER